MGEIQKQTETEGQWAVQKRVKLYDQERKRRLEMMNQKDLRLNVLGRLERKAIYSFVAPFLVRRFAERNVW